MAILVFEDRSCVEFIQFTLPNKDLGKVLHKVGFNTYKLEALVHTSKDLPNREESLSLIRRSHENFNSVEVEFRVENPELERDRSNRFDITRWDRS